MKIHIKILLSNTFYSFLFFCISFFGIAAPSMFSRFDNFTQRNGLSSNVVQCIYQDKDGWMWFGTSQGLNLYDGYSFKIYKNEQDNSKTIQGDLVRSIFQDSKNNFWIGTEKGGLNKYNIKDDSFSFIPLKGEKDIPYSANSIQEDKNGKIWIGTERGLAFLNENQEIEFHKFTSPQYNGLTEIKKIHIDRYGNIWIGSTKQGLCFYNPSNEGYKEIKIPYDPYVEDEIQTIFQSKDNSIWIGTYYSGIFMLNPETFHIEKLKSFPMSERGTTVRAITEDANGYMWFGSRGGLFVYDRKKDKYEHFTNDIANNITLVQNSIIDLYLDSKGDLWIGTRGGISFRNQEKQKFHLIREAKNDNRYLNNDELYAFMEDENGNLWIGTESGGINILNKNTFQFQYITQNDGLSTDCIKCFMEDGNNIWVGTYMGGINIIDKRTKKIKHVFRNNPILPESLLSDKVWNIYKDSKNRIWIATSKGVELYDRNKQIFIHFKQIVHDSEVYWISEDKENDLWIGTFDEIIIYNPEKDEIIRHSERTRSFIVDKNGKYWLGTHSKGLALYHKYNGVIKYYTEKDGLINNNIQTISEDSLGTLWLTTTNGLSRFNPQTEIFKNYDEYDGLQDAQYHYNAACKMSTGEIVIGGINGLNIFNPTEIKENNFIPPVMLSEFRIFNKAVNIGKNMSENISTASEVTLDYNQNMFSFLFTALSYSKSEKNQFMYKMEGFDNDWIFSGYNNRATYTNLNPGKYLFRVKGANCDGKWNDKSKDIYVIIKPPFWKTWWFETIFIITILLILFYLARFYLNRAKLNNELLFEKTKTRKLEEIEMIKTNFFTNISHELRTPLTLIIGPIGEILKRKDIAESVTENAKIAEKNANQLLQMVNQLLDFRKLETGKYKIAYTTGDLVLFLRTIIQSFQLYARMKNISVSFESTVNEFYTDFDEDKIQKICNNLLSNAIKYTAEKGIIRVSFSIQEQYIFHNEKIADAYMIKVRDNGCGISKENTGKIFDRFFQNSDSDSAKGTGIGLSITKEFIELMNGDIDVESQIEIGTIFSIHLPILQKQNPQIEKIKSQIEDNLENKILLIVEDNEDLRHFVVSKLKHEYTVYEAKNGEEALELAIKHIPDIIITDLIMPKMKGDELCRKIKNDERTSHIPVILLTAINSKETEIESLKSGADDYISKPFDINILQQKLENLLLMQENLRKKYKCEILTEPNNIATVSPDEKFLNKVMNVIEQNISDPDLDIEKFASEVGVSRMQLYRKISALTNMTVKEFIRNIRIKRAIQLLEQDNMTISEIAYEVGFKDIAYFRKCFKAHTGMNPSDYVGKTKS